MVSPIMIAGASHSRWGGGGGGGLLGFWLRNASLVKVGNPISDGIVFFFSPCLMRKRV